VLLAQNTSTNAVLPASSPGSKGGSGKAVQHRELTPRKLRAWDTGGRTVAEGPVRSGFRIVHEDPLAGSWFVDFSSSPKTLESYDERLNLRWRVDIIDRGVGGFAVDRAGRTLVLFDADYATAPQAVDAVWWTTTAPRDQSSVALGRQSSWPHLGIDVTQRVGSGLFFRADQWWQIDSLATVVQPPPDWFARRPFSGLHMVHGGTGYAGVSRPAARTRSRSWRPPGELRDRHVQRRVGIVRGARHRGRVRRQPSSRSSGRRTANATWKLHLHLAVVARVLPLTRGATRRGPSGRDTPGAADPAVSAGVLREILLVVVLGVVEGRLGDDLGVIRPWAGLGERALVLLARRFRGFTLRSVVA